LVLLECIPLTLVDKGQISKVSWIAIGARGIEVRGHVLGESVGGYGAQGTDRRINDIPRSSLWIDLLLILGKRLVVIVKEHDVDAWVCRVDDWGFGGCSEGLEIAAAKARYYPTRASTLRLVFSLWPKQTLRIHQWPFYVSQSYQ